MVADILKKFHDDPAAGHRGLAKTLDLIKRYFFWPGLYTDVKLYIQNCLPCIRFKTKRPPLVLQQCFETFTHPMQRVALDIVGPLTVTLRGNKYILTIQDTSIRYPEAVAIPNMTTDTVARAFVEYIICRFGPPETLLCDRGRNFTSELMKRVCKLLNISQIFISAFHPAGNSHLERSHKSFSSVIANYVRSDHRDWDDQICFVLLEYRNTIHSCIKQTPSFMMFGCHIEMPWADLLKPNRPSYKDEEDYSETL
jgi:hypothetical protein